MTVNEAPRLTLRVTVLLTIATFVLCLLLDSNKCQNTERTTKCIGEVPYRCNNGNCHDIVSVSENTYQSPECETTGERSILIHVIDFSASSLASSGNANANTAKEVLKALKAKYERGRSQSQTLSRSLFESPFLYDMLRSDSMQYLFKEGARNVTLLWSADAFQPPTSAELNREVDSAIEDAGPWRRALRLSLSRDRRKTHIVRTQLPQLTAAMEKVLKRHRNSASVKCNVFDVVLFLVGSPGPHTKWASGNTDGKKVALEIHEAHFDMRTILTHFFYHSKQYAGFLHEVFYVPLLFGFSTHTFVDAVTNQTIKLDEPNLSVAAGDVVPGVLVKNEDLRDALSTYTTRYCQGHSTATCVSECNATLSESALLHDIGVSLRNNMQWHSSSFTKIRPYVDCFYNVSVLAAKAQPGEKPLFADCLHLSSEGLSRFAECLVDW